jgi:anti-sigma factor RsiW
MMTNQVHCPMQTGDESAAAILLDYVDRKLDADTMERVDRHVAQCDQCHRMVESQRMVWAALDEWRPEEITDSFNARLADRLAAEQRAPWWKSLTAPVSAWWKPAMPLAAAACMLLVAVGLWKAGPSAQDFEKKAAVHFSGQQDPQQLEDTLSDLEMLRQLGVAEDGAVSRQAL